MRLATNTIQLISSDHSELVTFEFGDKNLWIDKIAGLSQSEVWLEIEADSVEATKCYLTEYWCNIGEEIERLAVGKLERIQAEKPEKNHSFVRRVFRLG